MAVGLLRPDAGRSLVFGADVWKEPERAKALMGVLPDGLAMPEQLTGRELLTYLGQLRGLDPASVRAGAGELLDVLELTGDAERTLIIDYSAGMRKKIGLATALLHAPRLLVLDEPFEAVDPVSAATIKRILARFVAERRRRAALEPRDGAGRAALRHRRGDGEGPRRRGRTARCGARRPDAGGGVRRARRRRGRRRRRAVVAGVLIRMKLTILRRAYAGPQASYVQTGAALGAAAAIATIALATLDADPATLRDLLAVTFALWTLGWALAPAYGGAPVLRPEHFTLQPVPRRRLALALLGAAFVGIGALVTLVAFTALIVLGARLGTVPVLLAIPGIALQLALVVVLSRLAARGFGALSRSRAGGAVSALITGVMLVAASSGWIVFVALDAVLESGFSDGFSTALKLLPSSWAGAGGREPARRCRCSASPRWWRCSCWPGRARSGPPRLAARGRPGLRTRRRRLGVPQGAAELVA